MKTKKQHIVMFIDGLFLPSGDGATWRFRQLLRGFLEAGSDVTVLHSYRGWSDIKQMANEPYDVLLIHPQSLKNPLFIHNLLLELHATTVVSKEMEYISFLLTTPSLPNNVQIIYNCHDYKGIKHFENEAIENIIAKLCDHVICISEKDSLQIEKSAKSGNVHYIPPTLDTEEIKPPKDYSGNVNTSAVFLGHFYYGPNALSVEWLITTIMPLILQEIPQFQLHLLGPYPNALKDKFDKKNITWHGFVDDPLSYSRQFSIALTPTLKGTGFRIKTLHSLAAGLPVVSNEIGIQGISDRECFLLGETPSELANRVIELFNNKELMKRMSLASNKLITEKYSAPILIDRLNNLLLSLEIKEPRDNRESLVQKYKHFLTEYSSREMDWYREIVKLGRFKNEVCDFFPIDHVFNLSTQKNVEQTLHQKTEYTIEANI